MSAVDCKGLPADETLVSIIMPVFNAEQSVGDAIQSCLAQTHANWELIVVDDASTDGSVGVVRGFDDSRIRLFVSSENRGPGAARNLALEVSRGEFICTLDADDLFHPARLEILLMEAKAHGSASDVVIVDRLLRWETFDVQPASFGKKEPPERLGEGPERLNPPQWFSPGLPFFHRSALVHSAVRYPTTRGGEDTAFLVRLVGHNGLQLVRVPTVTYAWRRSPGSLTTRSFEHARHAEWTLDILAHEFAELPEVAGVIHDKLVHARAERRIAEFLETCRSGHLIESGRQLLRCPGLSVMLLWRIPLWIRERSAVLIRRWIQHRMSC
jgi:succinoglycan biosynthesis protein ExoO